MITIRKSSERGHFDHGWLDTYHTFSFGRYIDRNHMGFRALRVINEDYVAPGMGFGEHPHDNMEILTYVTEGAIRHRDSMGNSEVLRAGELQRMTAGSGITHSEFNDSETQPLRLLQIWLHPDREEIEPSYEQLDLGAEEIQGLRLVASPDARDGSMRIHQDATLSLGRLSAGTSVEHRFAPGRHGWVQVIKGAVTLNGQASLGPGDGASITEVERLLVNATSDSEFLLFDLA